jgi:hypothetical protein
VKIAKADFFQHHLISFLYGRKQLVTGKVTVHWVWIPQQTPELDRVPHIQEGYFDKPNEIAALFGMELVGMAISRPFTDTLPFSPVTIEMAARFQFKNEHFVTLIIMPKGDGTLDAKTEPYQGSDAAVKLVNESSSFQRRNQIRSVFVRMSSFAKLRDVK